VERTQRRNQSLETIKNGNYTADFRVTFTNPVRARSLENRYAAQLRRVAKQIGMLIEGWSGEVQDLPVLRSQLQRYADVLTPWAKATVGRIGAELVIKERQGWAAHARLMGRQMRYELENAPTGVALQTFMNRQVELIRSLPIEAGDRVHGLVLESMIEGTRARELAKEVMATEQVTRSRANLIARTEISTASTNLTRARAQSIGSEQAIWRTSRDSMVRKSHREMEGRVFRWDEPPHLSDGTVCLPGCIYNCRCWAEPIIPGLGLS
jgi:SPP1 gp7 family putative phage head morphogenesis protein